jgi:opacity protein-like surface antigen
LNFKNKINTMNKLYIIAITLLSALTATAQSNNYGSSAPAADVQVEVTPFIGYQMGASTNSYYGKLRYRDGESYQISMNFDIVDAAEIELSYNYSKSYLELDNYSYYPSPPIYGNRIDANYHFYQVGVLKGMRMGNIKPYGLMTLGAAHMTFTDKSQVEDSYNTDDVWRFAFNLGLGVKYYMSDRIGIRIQGKLNLPISGVGFGIGCGGGGCGSGVSTTSYFVQGEVQAGLIIVLKPANSYSSKGSQAPANSSAGLW